MSKSTKSVSKKSTKKASVKKGTIRKSLKPKKLSAADKADLAAREAAALERAVDEAEQRALDARAPKTGVVTKPEVTVINKEPEKPVKAKKEPRVSMSAVADQMIKDGATDEAVMKVLMADFGVPAEKRHYPSWFRARLVRTNVITKEFGDEHRHAFDENGKVIV